MRKLFLVILLTGLIVFSGFAQMNDKMFGVKGGLTLGKISLENDIPDDFDGKFRMGFAIGGFVLMPLNENMSVQGELMYVMKGQKWEGGGIYEDLEITADVIEVPILLRYVAMENIAFYGGFSFDYLLSAKEKYGSSDDYDLIEEEMVNRFGYGLSFGAQYLMNDIVFDLRYDLGLSNYMNEDKSYHDFYGDTKTNTIYITVGYLFE